MLELAQHEEDDDDNHLCIKCNATIIGLDNYVAHRKNACGKPKTSEPTKIQPEKDCNQGADVFFQSLQLQSSVKRPSTSVQPIASSSKMVAGVRTRRATAAIIALSRDLYTSQDTPPDIVSNKRGEDWIGGHSLKVTECDDNQTKLIKAVANISGSAKKESILTSFNILDEYKHDEDSNEDSDESDDIDEEEQTGGKWKPMISHSGGKWKPIFSGRDSTTHWTTVSAITPEPDHIDDWEDEHTGGKWKTFMTQPVEISRIDKLNDMEEEEDDAYMPPPGHTKGKWIPGAKDGIKNDHKAHIMDAMALHKEGGSIQYWCGPCNRRLGSRSIYERHLTSKLHLKRTLPEKDLEFSGTFKTEKNENLSTKRTSKPSSYLSDYFYVQLKKPHKKKIDESLGIKKRRNRCPTFVICMVCKYKVKPNLLGKHLISHYHFRRGDLNDEFNKAQILDNIHKIVRQSPFQCSPCKFYANWQAEFMRHWRTKAHRQTVENSPGRFWCSFCKFECKDFAEITDHLKGDDHQEVVAAINRSIPIIIRKRSVLSCPACKKEFKYNIQMKKHMKTSCSTAANSTASDEYQGRKKCNVCPFKCKTKFGIARHMKQKHNEKLYYCSACGVQFNSSDDARHHRRSQDHRIKEKESRKEKGFEVKDLSKSCSHCDAPKFKNILELKQHLQKEHKDVFSSCSLCGMKFTLPQEVTWHLRNKACVFNAPESRNDQMWNCRFCPFVTSSHAECIYHEVLHGEPNKEQKTKSSDEKRAKRYSCPICHKIFSKHSLRCHLRMHTDERPHVCEMCDGRFSRRSNLLYHMKKIHSKQQTEEVVIEMKVEPVKTEEEKPIKATPKHFLCSVCGASFNKKFILQQHITTHAGRHHPCLEEGCLYRARNASELRLHAATHSDERPHRCAQCSYSAKTKMQILRHSKSHLADHEKKIQCPLCSYTVDQRSRLERHLRHHTGHRPFACRYCTYTCNSLENLRKHVLSRTIHKNKFLYECEFCSPPDKYNTNFAKEFRVHLTVTHPTQYPDFKSTALYVTNYLKDDRPLQSEQDSVGAITFVQSEENPEEKSYNAILDVFPSESCYNVNETGALVPYLGE